MDVTVLENVLRKAHLAGDTVAAKKIATALKAQRDKDSGADRGNFVQALGQGATLGLADEIVGGVNAAVGTFDPTFSDTTFGERYEANRDGVRFDTNAFRAREPEQALAAELVGGLATGGLGAGRVAAVNTGGKLANAGRNIGSASLLGAVYGGGASEEDTALGVAKDAGKGGFLGGLTAGALTSAGLLGRSALKKLVKPETSKLHSQSVDVLKKNDIPLTTGQQTGSARVKAVETNFSQGLLGPNLEKTLGDQRTVLQSKLMSKAGFDANDIPDGLITETALANAKDKFTTRYTAALKNVRVKLDNDGFINSLANVEAKHQQFLPTQQKKEVTNLIGELIDTAAEPGGITGKEYQSIRSRIGKRAQSLKANDPTMSNFFGDMKRALDDSFLDSVDDVTGQAKKNIDKEFSRFKQLQTIYQRGGGQQVESGVLPLASLNRESKKSGGDKPWRELLGSASRVLPDSIPNSGTASRMMNEIIPFGLLSKTANAGTLGVPFAAQKLLSSGAGGNLGRPIGAQTFAPLRRAGLLATPGVNAIEVR